MGPNDTVQLLCAIFPAFDRYWAEQMPGYEWNHHTVMRTFLEFFGRNRDSATDKQLRALGDWINRAVAEGGVLENAVSTCFLEHASQVRVARVLRPFLSPAAKEQTR